MSCPDKQMLLAWMDGELKGAEAEKIATHINSCEECKNYIKSQKVLEKAWREGWHDPAKEDFEQMRNTLQQANSPKKWWSSQRTWYIAAVLCAAYLGGKIFIIDNAATSLSDIAVSEQLRDNAPASEISVDVDDVAFETELETEAAEVVEEQEEEAEATPIVLALTENEDDSDELIMPSEEPVEIEEIVAFDYVESGIAVQESSSFVTFAEGSSGDYSVTGYGSGGFSGEEISETEIDLYDDRIAEDAQSGLIASDEPSGVPGEVNSVTSAVAGGGGAVAAAGHRLVGGSVTTSAAAPEECVDQEILDVTEQPSSIYTANRDRSLLKDCSVQIVMSSGSIAFISSSLWPALFDLLESILENNPLYKDSEIMLLVDETGNVEGPGVEEGTVIEVPDQAYENCLIHIHF